MKAGQEREAWHWDRDHGCRRDVEVLQATLCAPVQPLGSHHDAGGLPACALPQPLASAATDSMTVLIACGFAAIFYGHIIMLLVGLYSW